MKTTLIGTTTGTNSKRDCVGLTRSLDSASTLKSRPKIRLPCGFSGGHLPGPECADDPPTEKSYSTLCQVIHFVGVQRFGEPQGWRIVISLAAGPLLHSVAELAGIEVLVVDFEGIRAA